MKSIIGNHQRKMSETTWIRVPFVKPERRADKTNGKNLPSPILGQLWDMFRWTSWQIFVLRPCVLSLPDMHSTMNNGPYFWAPSTEKGKFVIKSIEPYPTVVQVQEAGDSCHIARSVMASCIDAAPLSFVRWFSSSAGCMRWSHSGEYSLVLAWCLCWVRY